MWHLSPTDVIRWPVGRRKRALRWKYRYEDRQRAKIKKEEAALPSAEDDAAYIWQGCLEQYDDPDVAGEEELNLDDVPLGWDEPWDEEEGEE